MSMEKSEEIDCHAVLGVPKGASAEEIRTEWRKLEALHHADPAKLREIDAAVDVLLDRAAIAESLRKAAQRGAATSSDDSDSLDFSPVKAEEPRPPGDEVDTLEDAETHKRRRTRAPAAAAPAKSRGNKAPSGKEISVEQMRKAVGSSDLIEAPPRRSLAIPLVIIAAIGVIALFAMTERPSKEVVTVAPPSKKAPPTYQGAPAARSQSQHPNTPPARPKSVPSQLETAALPPVQASVMPAEFVQAFLDYAKKTGSKAIALALDKDGRSAFGSVARHATQKEANDDALSECTRFKTQAGIQASCRLYAVGDQVTW